MSDTHDLASVLAAAERAAAAGDFSIAEGLLREAARRQEAELGPEQPELAHTLNNLGVICERVGKLTDAERCYRRARDIAAAALPLDHPFVLTSERNLREFCAARGLPLEPPGRPAAAALPEPPTSGASAPATRPLPTATPAGLTDGSVSAASARPGPAPAPAGEAAPSAAAAPGGPGGSASEPRGTRRPPMPRASRRGPAMTAAGAAALVLLILFATRTCRDAHEPADSAGVPAETGPPGLPAEAAGASSGAGSPAPGDLAGETHAVGSPAGEVTPRPDEHLGGAGEGSARSGESRSARAEGARVAGSWAAVSGELGQAPDRAGTPGGAGPDVSARTRRTSPSTVTQPRVAGGAAPPRTSRAPRRGPSPPERPAVTEARLCASLSAATWRCRPATSPVGTGPLVFYTRVRAQRATTVHHRWYAGARLRQAVALRIGPGAGDGYRTFSRTRVFPVTGGWRVELRAQDGTLLYEARFEVR